MVGERSRSLFAGHVNNGLIEKYTNGEWSTVVYKSRCWYFARPLLNADGEETEKMEVCSEPFCRSYTIAGAEHEKSTSNPNCTLIIFDEFLTRVEVPNEFILFENLLSTIIRLRDDVLIFLLGNTVNQWSTYYTEMGLTHVQEQEIGTIDVYEYGQSGLRVAVEYCNPYVTKDKSKAPSDIYFSFDNPKLKMVTSGLWELDIYPKPPVKWLPHDVIFSYFIEFNGKVLQADVIDADTGCFTFIHLKTTPYHDEDAEVIFRAEYDNRPNIRRSPLQAYDNLGRKIAFFFQTNRVFYQDNQIGDMIRNYLENVV